MGEAWFMAKKRKMHTRLMTEAISACDLEYLGHVLGEITSGTSSFGHLEEWDTWFRYLLPELVIRGHEEHAFDRLLEHTVSAFMQVYWTGVPPEYPEFRQDALDSVPISLMHPALWSANPGSPSDPTKSIPTFLMREHNGRLFVEWYGVRRAQPDLSAALFFCLKYLPHDEMPSWVNSLLSIEHPYWKAALLVWLAGAQPLLTATAPVAPSLVGSISGIGWENSHALGSPPSADGDNSWAGYNENSRFLDATSTGAFWEEIRSHFADGLLVTWESELWSDPRLAQIPGLTELLDQIARDMAA